MKLRQRSIAVCIMETLISRVLWFQRGARLLCVRGSQRVAQAQGAQPWGTESSRAMAAVHCAGMGPGPKAS